MRLVTMTRDMRPWQAGHDVALPDAAAKQLIDAGDAVPSKAESAANLKPDVPDGAKPAPATSPAAPGRNRYLTRDAKR